MKRFRSVSTPRDQVQMFPRTLDEYVPAEAPVRAFSEIIDALDLSWLTEAYRGGGRPAYHPAVLLKVLVFAYSEGLRSSRRIAQALETDVRFMWLSEGERPDHRTLCRFRKANEAGFHRVFVETVRLCQRLGLVTLRHVAVDGTKIEANASKESTYYARTIGSRLSSVEETIQRILEEADQTDEQEEAELGEARGDEMPAALRDATERKARLERARQEMEEEGLNALVKSDRDARLMKTGRGIRPAYNGQAAVDGEAQVIVGADVVQAARDVKELPGVLEQTARNAGGLPNHLTADAGYHSIETERYVRERGLDAYVPPAPDPFSVRALREAMTYDEEADVCRHADGRVFVYSAIQRKNGRLYRVYRCGRNTFSIRQDRDEADKMRAKLRTPQGRAIFALRRQTVEPVFGRLKETLRLRRFLLRGLSGANIEFRLACIAHNLAKAMRAAKSQAAMA